MKHNPKTALEELIRLARDVNTLTNPIGKDARFFNAAKAFADEIAPKLMEMRERRSTMILKDLIEFLSQCDQAQRVSVGFNNPHSYRGYYDELAFEPVENVTIGEMLNCAQEANGKTYSGYKGGDFEMGPYTRVNLAYYGCVGEAMGPVLLSYMVGKPVAEKRT